MKYDFFLGGGSSIWVGWNRSAKSHPDFHDTPEKDSALRAEYEEFQMMVEPTCCKVDRVIYLLTQLSPEAPSLASTIDQLCQVFSVHVKKIKDILTQCFNVLDMFTKLCMLYRFQYGWFQCKMSSLLTVESG